jgi:hypothetical protein
VNAEKKEVVSQGFAPENRQGLIDLKFQKSQTAQTRTKKHDKFPQRAPKS